MRKKEIRQTVLFCSTHRSGSSALMEMLTKAGCLGIPDEYFCPENRAQYIRENNLSEGLENHKVVEAILEDFTSENGIFSAKLFPDNLDWILTAFGAKRESLNQGLLKEIFPNPLFVWIDRRNKLEQAISLVKSQQTSLWHSDSNPSYRHLRPYYDRGRISRAKRILESDSKRWDAFFRNCGLQPLKLYYENFSTDLKGTVKAILDFLQIEWRTDEIPLPAKRILRDSISQDWKKRYEEETDIIRKTDSIEFLDRQRPTVEIQADLQKTLAAGFPAQLDFTLKNLLPIDLYCLGDKAWTGRYFLFVELVSASTNEKVQATSTFPSRWGAGQELKMSMIINSPRKEGVYSVFAKVLQRDNGFLQSVMPFREEVSVIDPVRSLYEAFIGSYRERADQWVYTSGFGYSFWKRFPWVLHELHGWIKLTGRSSDRLFLNDQVLGDWEIVKEGDELTYISEQWGRFSIKPNPVCERIILPHSSGKEIKLPHALFAGNPRLFGESPDEISNQL